MVQLTDADKRILKELQSNAKISNSELAERCGLSASACHRRVRDLEAAGIIGKYIALLDAKKIGKNSVVFVEITLIGQSQETFEAFERDVVKLPNLLECHLMAGKADYQLKLIANDAEDFAYIHRHYLSRLPGVANMQSSFALKTVHRTTALPLED